VLHRNFSSGAPFTKVDKDEHECGQSTAGMLWQAPGEQSVVRTTILDVTSAPKRTEQPWPRENDAKIGTGDWIWWTDGSHSEDGRVVATAQWELGNQCRSPDSVWGTVRMEVIDTELWAIGLAVHLTVPTSGSFQRLTVRMVAVLSDS